jgi:hypothetical protein
VSRRFPNFFSVVLSLIFVLFVSILIFVYVVTKRTNPVILDQHGKPVTVLVLPGAKVVAA